LNLGVTHREADHSAVALPLLREALDLVKEQHPEDDPNVLLCARELAEGLHLVGNHDEAMSLLEESWSLAVAKRGSDDPDVRKIEAALNNYSKTNAVSEDGVSFAVPRSTKP
jgi:hypothetical protein